MRPLLLAGTILLAACSGNGADTAVAGSRNADARCAREPLAAPRAFFTPGEPSREVTASIVSEEAAPEVRGVRYLLRTPDGESVTLTWIGHERLPLETGRPYRFHVEYVPGWPEAAALVVREGEEIVFASLNDQKPLQRVGREALPGWSFTMLDPGCPSRPPTRCHRSLVNVPVRIAACGGEAALMHGESAQLCGLTVRLLTAQVVEYDARCADAGLPGFALTIAR